VNKAKQNVLTINGGSSSIKFAWYQIEDSVLCTLSGKIDRIGLSKTTLTFSNTLDDEQDNHRIDVSDYPAAANFLIDWLEQQAGFSHVSAVGHRVVHGMQHSKPEIISQSLLDELHRISSYDPDHLPGEIYLIETFRQRYPHLPQVACFDTAFHHSLPRVAKLLPVPHRFDAMGIQRYGFHGLSYAYLMQTLERLDDKKLAGKRAAEGRVVLAHLGNGASMAAVRDGRSVDTTMGFTPAGGLPMGTRSGDLDPGVAWYMMQSENLTLQQFNHLINHESGLLGVSETSSDMRDLIKNETTDERAAEAIELFCYQVKKNIGAYAAVLGGLDALVFSGGIGENAPTVRARICDGLEFLGIELEENRNARNEDIISAQDGRVTVRVIHTDEQQMIATMVVQHLG
jgi:acetate kinase